MLDFVLQEILRELQKMNATLEDIHDEISEINQNISSDALAEICDKLDGISNAIDDMKK